MKICSQIFHLRTKNFLLLILVLLVWSCPSPLHFPISLRFVCQSRVIWNLSSLRHIPSPPSRDYLLSWPVPHTCLHIYVHACLHECTLALCLYGCLRRRYCYCKRNVYARSGNIILLEDSVQYRQRQVQRCGDGCVPEQDLGPDAESIE